MSFTFGKELFMKTIRMMANKKFEFDGLHHLKSVPVLENIKTGECDFDFWPAVQGRKLDKDVFYVCESCKNKLSK